jgi:non-specific serine/threonine protein kinase
VLSLKAGGSGLTLTAASHVAHFDRWRIPAVENQATARAFRIGQKRNVPCTNSSAVAQSTSESTP